MITEHMKQLARAVLDVSNDHDPRAFAERLEDARLLAERVLDAALDDHADCTHPCGLVGCPPERLQAMRDCTHDVAHNDAGILACCDCGAAFDEDDS